MVITFKKGELITSQADMLTTKFSLPENASVEFVVQSFSFQLLRE